MFWLIVNSVGFVGTPVGLVWAWVSWAKRNRGEARVRESVGLIAVVAASLSPVIFFVVRFFHPSASHALDWVGVALACIAIAISLFGYLRLAIPVTLAAAGSLMLWYGMTLR
jgi:hypothetical protein